MSAPAVYSATGATVSLASLTIASCEKFEVKHSASVQQYKVLGSTAELVVSGGTAWTISLSGLFDTSIAAYNGAPPALLPGTTVAMSVLLTTGKTMTGSVIISSLNFDLDPNGAIKISVEGIGTGALTYPS